MGIGHRVYKNGDPRVKHLKRLSKALNEQKGTSHWVEISERIEVMHGGRERSPTQRRLLLRVCVLRLGIPPVATIRRSLPSASPAGPPHLLEQYRENRLIRPRAVPSDRAIERSPSKTATRRSDSAFAKSPANPITHLRWPHTRPVLNVNRPSRAGGF